MALILFVDDDILTLQMMRQAAEIVGHEAITGRDCSSAVQMAIENHPDLIFLDFNLQGTNGYEVLQEIRLQEITSEIPIIFLSAEAEQSMPEDVLANGAQAYLNKPIRLNLLIEVIRKYTDA
ncbi:MAG: response regulator [Anaerolineales bacterium]|nr:response regulator [Anaerolineales bacterium]